MKSIMLLKVLRRTERKKLDILDAKIENMKELEGE